MSRRSVGHGPDNEIRLHCQSGDFITAFTDHEGLFVIHLPAPARGLPRAVLNSDEMRALITGLEMLVEGRAAVKPAE